MVTSFETMMIDCLPHLRAYGRSLTKDPDMADDLVQDTIVRAIGARESFQEGTNLKAWLFTILRNKFLDDRRRKRGYFEQIENVVHERLVCPPSQDAAVEFANVAAVFWSLSAPHREILMLIGVNGLNYEEAAAILGCPIGTVRSRLSRARTELQKKLSAADADDGEAELRALGRHLPALLAA
jgi:RNA polymerase sigma-70 factor (ECF subfamily)